MLRSFQSRMALLLGAAVLLVVAAVGSALYTVSSLQQDALVINLAGRQRMLLQRIARGALLLEKDPAAASEAMQESIETFDRSLWALTHGGPAPYGDQGPVQLPAAREREALARLGDLHRTWDALRGDLQALIARPGQEGLSSRVQGEIDRAVAQADAVVRAFQAASDRKVGQLQGILATFVVGALALLAVGAWAVRQGALIPLDHLGRHTARIASGDLSQPVEAVGPQEFAFLARRFESMRLALADSRQGLEERVRRRTSELDALYQVSQEILSQLDLDHVLRSVTEKTRHLLRAEAAFLCLAGPEGSHLHPKAVCGPPEAFLARAREPLEGEGGGLFLQGGSIPCRVEDCGGSCSLVTDPYRASHLAAPLKVGGRVVGTLCVAHSKPEAFSGEDAELLVKLGDVAAVAVQNARLYERAERAAMLEERRRVAEEMHDGLAQWISYLQLQAEQLQQAARGAEEKLARGLEKLRQDLARAAEEVRRTIDHLHQGGVQAGDAAGAAGGAG